jgi:hypothetical protein
MKLHIRSLLATLSAIFLIGCSATPIDDRSRKIPELNLEEYFDGNTQASGMFVDRFGKIRRQFTVEIIGTNESGVLTLEEFFSYQNGETEQRTWAIKKTSEATYEGRADDVIGIAKGQGEGNVVRWSYDTRIHVGKSMWRVHFDDWMLLQDNGVLLNRATVSFWGLHLGTVWISFIQTDTPFDGQEAELGSKIIQYKSSLLSSTEVAPQAVPLVQ